MKNISDKSYRENENTVSFPENRAFYDTSTVWKIIVQQSRPHMSIKYGVCALRVLDT